MMLTSFEVLFIAKKIPLNPPFSKGEGVGRGDWFFPLFGKEGLGEIFVYGNQLQITP
jgi:hypothetical protein